MVLKDSIQQAVPYKPTSSHSSSPTSWASTYVEGSQAWFPNLLEINIKVATNLTSEFAPLNSLFNLTYLNQYISFMGLNNYNLLDYITLLTSRPRNKWNSLSQTLFTRLATDWVPQNSLYLYPLVFIYQYEQHNSDDLIRLISPDLVRVLSQQINTYWVSRTLLTNSLSVFDITVQGLEKYDPGQGYPAHIKSWHYEA